MNLHCLRRTLIAALGMGILPAAHSVDSFSLEVGSAHHLDMARVGLQWKWNRRWLQTEGRHIGGYWDASIAYWRGTRFRNMPGSTQDITTIGITPVLRLQNDFGRGFYAEAGIGLHLLSAKYNNNGRQLSTRLQFGDHLAIGYIFENSLDVGLRLQHFSNGSIKKPNDGVNVAIARLSYEF